MGTINYASKYSELVDERFALGQLTQGAVNQDYEWIGVETVNVFSVPTVEMNDYSLTGTSRYGTPDNLENDKQELKVEKDRSFTFVIDRKSHDDTMMTMEAASALRRQIDEVVIPEVDTYRLNKLATAQGVSLVKGVTSASNAYEIFLSVQEKLDEAKAPQGGRIAYVTPAFYKLIKLDDAFVKKGDMATEIAIKGVVGEIDGVPVVKVPSSYMAESVDLIITNPACCPAPIKLESYIIHEDPVGISGWVCEGRIRYDAFVLKQKASAVGVHKSITE